MNKYTKAINEGYEKAKAEREKNVTRGTMTHTSRAKIFLAAKELGLDVHELIGDRYGKDSVKELTPAEVADLLDHYKSQGWVPKYRAKQGRTIVGTDLKSVPKKESQFKKFSGPYARQQRLVMVLWTRLGYEPRKIDTMIKKRWPDVPDRFEWLQDGGKLHALITDLKARCKNQNAKIIEVK